MLDHITAGNYANSSKEYFKEKEEDVSVILQGRNEKGLAVVPAIKPQGNNQTNNYVEERRRRCEINKGRTFTHLEDSLDNILALLVAHKKIASLFPPSNLKRRNYDTSKRYAYHCRYPSHSIKNCWPLKHKIHDLIDIGEIMVQTKGHPNMATNPLPNHEGSSVNMIEK